MSSETSMDPIEAIEAKRAARKERLEAERKAQYAKDLEAVDALEEQLGDSNVAMIELPYTPGMPALAAVRCPTSHELKRYQDMIRPRNVDGKLGNATEAMNQLGRSCLVFPEGDALAALLEARPGLPTQAGTEALGLAKGRAEAEGN